MANEFVVRFEGLELSDANVAARSLREAILDLGEKDVSVQQHKQSQNTMDFGATLVLVLGAPAAVAIAKGIAQWIAKEGERAGKIVIETKSGTVVATGHATKNIDVAKTVAALSKAGA